MHHADLVRGREGGGNVRTDAQRLAEREGAALREEVAEVHSLQEFHDDEGGGAGGGFLVHAGVVDGDDVRVGELGGRAGLAEDAGGEFRVGGVLEEDGLHRHATAEQRVEGLPNLAHPAMPDPPEEFVVFGE